MLLKKTIGFHGDFDQDGWYVAVVDTDEGPMEFSFQTLSDWYVFDGALPREFKALEDVEEQINQLLEEYAANE